MIKTIRIQTKEKVDVFLKKKKNVKSVGFSCMCQRKANAF